MHGILHTQKDSVLTFALRLAVTIRHCPNFPPTIPVGTNGPYSLFHLHAESNLNQCCKTCCNQILQKADTLPFHTPSSFPPPLAATMTTIHVDMQTS